MTVVAVVVEGTAGGVGWPTLGDGLLLADLGVILAGDRRNEAQ